MSNNEYRNQVILAILLAISAIGNILVISHNQKMKILIADQTNEINRIQTINETQKKLIKIQNINIESRKQLREQENKSCRLSDIVA